MIQIADVRARLNVDVEITPGTGVAPAPVESFEDMVCPLSLPSCLKLTPISKARISFWVAFLVHIRSEDKFLSGFSRVASSQLYSIVLHNRGALLLTWSVAITLLTEVSADMSIFRGFGSDLSVSSYEYHERHCFPRIYDAHPNPGPGHACCARGKRFVGLC